jgi:hypothetical protein
MNLRWRIVEVAIKKQKTNKKICLFKQTENI